MPAPFKSPEEAINECNAACDAAWSEFATLNKFDVAKLPPQVIESARDVFRRGYYAGARWVTNSIIEQMPNPNTTGSVK